MTFLWETPWKTHMEPEIMVWFGSDDVPFQLDDFKVPWMLIFRGPKSTWIIGVHVDLNRVEQESRCIMHVFCTFTNPMDDWCVGSVIIMSMFKLPNMTQSLNKSGPNKDQRCQMGELFPRSNKHLQHILPRFFLCNKDFVSWPSFRVSQNKLAHFGWPGGGAGFGDMAETLFWAQQLGLSRPMASCPGIAGGNDAVQATTQGLCLSLGVSGQIAGWSQRSQRRNFHQGG